MNTKTSSRKSFRGEIAYGCGGLITGLFIMAVIATGLFIQRFMYPPILPPTSLPAGYVLSPGGTATSIPTVTPRPSATTTPIPSPTDALEGLLVRAERELQRGEPQAAIDLLAPELNRFTQAESQERLYICLAQAEEQLYHFQLAAAYYDRLYMLDPTAEHLYWLASAYYMGGDHQHALEKYQALLTTTGAEADEYRSFAEEISQHLKEILGTSTPESLSVP